MCGARPGSAAEHVEGAFARAHVVVVSRATGGPSGCRNAAAGALDPG